MWCEEGGFYGFYYDVRHDGSYLNVKTVASFIPFLAGAPSRRQAEKLLSHLISKRILAAIPGLLRGGMRASLLQGNVAGSTWPNFQPIVVEGLLNYGFTNVARTARDKTRPLAR